MRSGSLDSTVSICNSHSSLGRVCVVQYECNSVSLMENIHMSAERQLAGACYIQSRVHSSSRSSSTRPVGFVVGSVSTQGVISSLECSVALLPTKHVRQADPRTRCWICRDEGTPRPLHHCPPPGTTYPGFVHVIVWYPDCIPGCAISVSSRQRMFRHMLISLGANRPCVHNSWQDGRGGLQTYFLGFGGPGEFGG